MTSVESYVRAFLKVVDPSRVKISYDYSNDILAIYIDGVAYRDVDPVKPFPLSNPNYVIFKSKSSGEDICIISDIRMLDKDSFKYLEYVINKKYFIPIIMKINEIIYTGEFFVCNVKTNKGDRFFNVRSRRNVFRLGNTVVIFDSDENLYLIDNYEKLDKKSKEELMKII
ncbi:DUF1854 domain-containing protein [Candidatus Bathyarchaeota archaeon]|nr:DUF1854 domain-containing protein [Candidatus Bathyarchaeota archaeon]MBS7613003.1 DUF1854 domain-containing protein [Candidatus Bathyarchaeota archaeon]MBS7617583.1 DUF1854 domain-containing protein [Candidatus Bathyarchaeota archaeon]